MHTVEGKGGGGKYAKEAPSVGKFCAVLIRWAEITEPDTALILSFHMWEHISDSLIQGYPRPPPVLGSVTANSPPLTPKLEMPLRAAITVTITIKIRIVNYSFLSPLHGGGLEASRLPWSMESRACAKHKASEKQSIDLSGGPHWLLSCPALRRERVD